MKINLKFYSLSLSKTKAILMLIVTLLTMNLSNAMCQKLKEKPLFTVDKMPRFPGGEATMQKFITTNLVYPQEVQEASIEGRVTIRFVVRIDGSISDVEVIEKIHPLCDSAALAVVKKMPRWEPGKHNGRAVPVYFTLPLVFRLLGDDEEVDKKTLITVPDNYIYIVNGVDVPEDNVKTVPQYRVDKMDVFEKKTVKALLKKYGEDGTKKDGIVIITLKKLI